MALCHISVLARWTFATWRDVIRHKLEEAEKSQSGPLERSQEILESVLSMYQELTFLGNALALGSEFHEIVPGGGDLGKLQLNLGFWEMEGFWGRGFRASHGREPSEVERAKWRDDALKVHNSSFFVLGSCTLLYLRVVHCSQ